MTRIASTNGSDDSMSCEVAALFLLGTAMQATDLFVSRDGFCCDRSETA